MFESTFHKYILVVVLFAIFVLLANVWHYRQGKRTAQVRRRRRRRRVGAPDAEPGPEAPDAEPLVEPKPSLMYRFSPIASVIALLLCIAALVAMWYAMGLGLMNG